MKVIPCRMVFALGLLLCASLSANAATTTLGITLSVPANPVTIKNPGQYNLYVTIAPHNGFTGSVSPSCMLIQSPQGATNLPTCPVSTPVVTVSTGPGPNNNVVFPLVILTAGMTEEQIPAAMTGDLHIPWLPFSSGVLACASCFFFPKRRKNWTLLLIALLATVSFGLIGCGSNKKLTTPGPYTFGITATAVGNSRVSASTTFTVIVQ
jgi:hypothetical protein